MERERLAGRQTPPAGQGRPETRVGQSVLKAAGIMAAVSVLTKVASFLRDSALASKFGAGDATDHFYAAGTIPLVALVVAAGAVTTAAVPVLSRRREAAGRAGLTSLAGALTGLLALLGALVGLLLLIFAGPVVHLLSPGYGPAEAADVAALLRLLAPVPFFLAIAAALTPTLWVSGEFAAPSLGQFGNSLTTVLLLVGLAAPLGIAAAAWGYVAAGVVQTLVLVLGLMLIRQPLRLRLWEPDLAEVGRLLVPVLISTGALQLGLVITRVLGSYLDQGGITYLTYATKVAQLPLAIFSAAVVTAVYPRLAAAGSDRTAFRAGLQQGLRLCLFVIAPLAAGALLFRGGVVALLFQHGRFGADQALVTAEVLGALAPGIVGVTVWDLSQRAFFARGESTPPVVVALGSVLLTVGLGLGLLHSLGALGVALAVTGGQLAAALALLGWLQLRSGALAGAGLGTWLLRLALALVIALGVGLVAAVALPHLVHGMSTTMRILRLGTEGALFLGAYGLASFALGLAEVRQAWAKVARKLNR